MRRPPVWLGLTFLLGACSREEWKLDVDPKLDAPLAVQRVVAHRTVAVSLGAGPAKLDSSTPKNSINFEVLLRRGPNFPEGAAVAHRTACLFGGKIWASRWIGGPTPVFSPEGTYLHSFSFMPNVFAPGPPTACELGVQAGAPGSFDSALPEGGTVCWTAERGLSNGPCDAASLPRGRALEDAADVKLEWGASGLSLAAAIPLGATVVSESDLTARAACEFESGPPKQSAFSAVVPLREFAPGETTLLQGSAFDRQSKPPTRCTVVVRRRTVPAIDPSKHVALATVCFEGGAVRDGACEGLAPGAVTVRVDASRQATLERGAHREGQLSLGGGAVVDWAGVIRSISASRDEAVILAAPRSMEQAAVVALVQELAAAQLPVALSVAPP